MTILAGNQSGDPLPSGRWQGVTMPTLAIVGGKSPTWFHNGMRELAAALPNAEHRVLDGQTHIVKATALAPLLTEFFTADRRTPLAAVAA